CGLPNTCKSNATGGFGSQLSGERVSNTWVIYLRVGDNVPKGTLIPHDVPGLKTWKPKPGTARPGAQRGARVRLASWRGNGPPRRRSVAGLRGRTATLGLRHGPDSYGRQQWGIVRNGRKPDDATPRGGRRSSGRKLLSSGKNASRVNSPRG